MASALPVVVRPDLDSAAAAFARQARPRCSKTFGSQMPMGRCGQPSELGSAYVYLACEDSSYVGGQTIHINGGKVING